MSPTARLAGFAALLAVAFAAAALAGAATEPGTIGGDAAGAEDSMAGHGEGAAPQIVRGLAVSDDGLTLELADRELRRGRKGALAFRILRADGSPLTRFEVEHEKRMHLIVVRRDGTGFQHLHPDMAPDGTWSTDLTLDDAGSYRVFADFTTAGTARTLAADLAVDGSAEYRELPPAAGTVRTVDGEYEVRLDQGDVAAGRSAELRFTVVRDGTVVRTEPYLGAGGHLVALRRGDLAYLHTHPAEDEEADDDHGASGPAVAFESTFPTEGSYRLYFQFKHAGEVRTAEFTQEVTR